MEAATDEHWALFAAWQDIYLSNDDALFLPGDLSTAQYIRKQFPIFAFVAPAVYGYALLCKEPRLMIMLMCAVRHLTSTQALAQSWGVIVSVTVAYAATAQTWGRQSEAQNLSTRGSGFLTVLQEWKVLIKASRASEIPEKTKEPSFKLAREFYTFVPLGEANEVLRLLVSSVVALRNALPPRTLAAWKNCYEENHMAINWPGAGKYLRPWFFRIFMITEMRANRIKSLCAQIHMTVDDFCVGFPDQKTWISRFGVGHDSIQDALRGVERGQGGGRGSGARQGDGLGKDDGSKGCVAIICSRVLGISACLRSVCEDVWTRHAYRAPPELYSMYSCFFLSDKMKATSVSVRENALALRSIRAAYDRAWGYGSIPSVAYNLLTATPDDDE